jgi:protein-tyrosine phosphatase
MHSHLLPGIDTAAKDLDALVALLDKMAFYGIKNLVSKPYILAAVYPNTPNITKSKRKRSKKHY